MKTKTIYEFTEIITLYDVDEVLICQCIEKEWILPVNVEKKLLDKEDVTRILLIKDLKEDFGVNDEAIPVILHLIDQLHWARVHLNEYLKKNKE
jgi:chaperone modulatory protein CbpM